MLHGHKTLTAGGQLNKAECRNRIAASERIWSLLGKEAESYIQNSVQFYCLFGRIQLVNGLINS
jgi:hypothetical protein